MLICPFIGTDGIFSAWDEIYEVFGDGTDYEWALGVEDEEFREEQQPKEMSYQDVRSGIHWELINIDAWIRYLSPPKSVPVTSRKMMI